MKRRGKEQKDLVISRPRGQIERKKKKEFEILSFPKERETAGELSGKKGREPAPSSAPVRDG